jgi:hypothetical protein
MPHTFLFGDVLHLLWGGQSCPQPPFQAAFSGHMRAFAGQRPAESRLQPGLAAPQLGGMVSRTQKYAALG